MIFRNNVAAYLWGFTVLVLLFVAAMTYLTIRYGALSGYSPIILNGTIAILWVGAFGLTAYALSKHCLCVTVLPDSRVSITWRFPFKKEEKTVSRDKIAPARVFESIDDEGVPYFHVHAPLHDGTTIKIAGGHDRASCEATCTRFNAMVWPGSTEDMV